jgi:hypothetical protein
MTDAQKPPEAKRCLFPPTYGGPVPESFVALLRERRAALEKARAEVLPKADTP